MPPGWPAVGWSTADTAADAETEQGEHGRTAGNRLVVLLKYALFDILAAIDLWLVAGILLAAAITTAIPADYFQAVRWTQGVGGMLLVLAVSLPLYVCTTSSVPIAASLIAAGMPAGTALVFLMAGPATNVATIGAIYRALGSRVLGLYLGTVIVASIGLGMGFDFVLGATGVAAPLHAHATRAWWETGSALILLGLLAFLLARRVRRRWRSTGLQNEANTMDLTLKVEGMTCQHCVANVKNALESVAEVERATADLSTGLVQVKGDRLHRDALAAAVTRAGYQVVEPI